MRWARVDTKGVHLTADPVERLRLRCPSKEPSVAEQLYHRSVTRFVIEAPTLIHIASEAVDVHPDHRLVVPNAIRTQALTLLLDAARRDEITDKEALALEDRMTEVKIRLLGDRVSRRTAWRIAREQGWEDLVDAEYVAIARLQADALVCADPGVTRRLQPLVPIAPVDALSLPPGTARR